MRKEIFWCDNCLKEITEGQTITYTHKEYDDDYGTDICSSYEFCSEECKKIQVEKLKSAKSRDKENKG